MKNISEMDHNEAGGRLRRLEFEDEGSPTERLALAERALETSPPEWRHVWRTRVQLYASGRWVRTKKVPVQTIDVINEVFE